MVSYRENRQIHIISLSVEQYTGYIVILQYYIPVPSNFFDITVLWSTDIVQYTSLNAFFNKDEIHLYK